MRQLPDSVLKTAKQFVESPLPYQFTDTEKVVIDRFFTNRTGRVFIFHTLPENIASVLLAMYSRMKNKRGLRGVFVDHFLPEMLTAFLPEFEEGAKVYYAQTKKALTPGVFLRGKKSGHNIHTLGDFLDFSESARNEYQKFLQSVYVDPDYLGQLASGERLKVFLGTWLDAYGHNSIARTAAIHLCFEGISILAAKSIEWCRPGAGYIELSTRYVDMHGTDVYPIEDELACYDKRLVEPAQALNDYLFYCYRELQGENFNGPFPDVLRKQYADVVPEEQMEQGIIGETCDVLGNFLPASTLTSVGATVSGEALVPLIHHLKMDNTPENHAIVHCICEEAGKVGADQFLRHLNPTPWQETNWAYLSPSRRSQYLACQATGSMMGIVDTFSRREDFGDVKQWSEVMEKLMSVPRGEYDKLSREFELMNATLWGSVSFRGWRDIQRQGFATHKRSRLTPHLGFYRYTKPDDGLLHTPSCGAHRDSRQLYEILEKANVPAQLREYPMALGHQVAFLFGANLREMEFCNWQRSKPSVNHEIREVFLGFENALQSSYPWWGKLSRANTTPAYVFARGSEIPLPLCWYKGNGYINHSVSRAILAPA